MLVIILGLLAGFAGLIIGAEGLVRGALAIAKRLRVPPVIVGLTIVAMGTSTPELVVSVLASIQGQDNISIANIVGSNIFNILFVLGLPALILPLQFSGNLFHRDIKILIAISLATAIFAFTGLTRSRPEAAVLMLGMLAYLWLNYRDSRNHNSSDTSEQPLIAPEPWLKSLVFLIGGIGLLVVGGQMAVNSAVAIATRLGISDTVIGLTIVAIGTSLPELVTSLVAAIRKETGIAVGNVVGSNIFNLLGILGIAGLIRPLQVDPSMLNYDIPSMIASAILLVPIIILRKKITRVDGVILLVLYGIYTLGLLIRS